MNTEKQTHPAELSFGLPLVDSYMRAVTMLVERIGQGVAWLIPTMMLLTNAVVFLRYGLSQGSIILQEAVLYLHATAFMLGFAYTLKQGGHVRVDLFYTNWSPKRQALVNLTGHLIFLVPFALVMGIGSLDYVVLSWKIQEHSAEASGIPAVFLLKTLLPLSALLILLQGTVEIGKSILLLRQPEAV